MEDIQEEADREGEEKYENSVVDGDQERTVDSKGGEQSMENISKTDFRVWCRNLRRWRVGGGGEITKRDGEENIRAEREYKQRSGARRVGVVEVESEERYAKTQVLVEINKHEARKTTEESI